jgi:hypothetical protein
MSAELGPVLEMIENALRADQAKMIEPELRSSNHPNGPRRPLPRYMEVSLRPTSFNGRVPARFPWKDEFMDLLIRLREWGPPKGGTYQRPRPRRPLGC